MHSVGEKVAAEALGVAVQTLRNWRCERQGPAYHKVGRRVIYTMGDLEDFLARRRIDPEGKARREAGGQ